VLHPPFEVRETTKHRKPDRALHSEAVGCTLPVAWKMKTEIPVRRLTWQRHQHKSLSLKIYL
jgi:hypothetical protein